MADQVEQELLGDIRALRKLPDDVDAHDVLARPPRPARALERRHEEGFVRHGELVILRRAVRGDRVEDIARLAGVERLVVGRGIPAHDRQVHSCLEEAYAELQGFETVLRLEHHVLVGILNRSIDRKSTRLNSSHMSISYAVFCLKKKKKKNKQKKN